MCWVNIVRLQQMPEVRLFLFNINQFPADDQIDNNESSYLRYSTSPHRVEMYHNRGDRCRCLAGELMVSKFIGPGVIRNDPEMSNRAIKPLIQDGSFFNISHDNDFVVMGTCTAQSVGIDIMKVKQSNPNIPIPDMLSNLKAIFTNSEWKYISSVGDPNDQLTRFFELWTAKEAYVKCIGTGLYTEPHELSLGGMETEVLAGWKNLSVTQVGLMHRSDKFRILVSTTIIPEHVIAVCVGPVEFCDKTWTRFIPKDSCCDPTETVSISPPIHVRLADLV